MSKEETFNCSKCQLVYVLPSKCDHYQELQKTRDQLENNEKLFTEIRYLKEQNEQLNQQLEEKDKMLNHWGKKNEEHIKAWKDAINVIEFYGNPSTYQNYGMGYLEPILHDIEDEYSVAGWKARQFLAKYKTGVNDNEN